MYEKRYHDSVGVSDLYKMKDVVNITDDLSGKQIFACPQTNFRMYISTNKLLLLSGLLYTIVIPQFLNSL